ncbi:MAG: DUF6969 family protein [Steroidobacteraceae bacterium]
MHARAADQRRRQELRWARQGLSALHLLLPPGEPPRVGQHYPLGDTTDARRGTSFYYHSHGPEERGRVAREHGHFHLFARPSGRLLHVVSIAVDPLGQPLAFTQVNGWVTGEASWSLAVRQQWLARWRVAASGAVGSVARWLRALLDEHERPLRRLLRLRQQRLGALSRGRPLEQVMQDRRTYTLASLAVPQAGPALITRR